MSKNKLNVGIILGSTRNGRTSPAVGEWVKSLADKREVATFEIVDIKEYHLPFLGESDDMTQVINWNNKLNELDAFIFVVAEYNHSITGALKNALDSARDAWNNKSAGIVSYGSAGGARAAEHLRGILGELQVADVRTHTLLSLFHDFKDGEFKPQAIHQANINDMLDQLITWGNALKSTR
jgi:NAD(P)H-dependent FMN reductase